MFAPKRRLAREMRREEGFSLLELFTTVVVMVLLIGIAIWSMKAHWQTHAAGAAKDQIINDLRLCSTLADRHKRTFGIHFRSDRCETNPNTYTFLRVEDDGTIVEIDPPQGASSDHRDVPLPDKAIIDRLDPQEMAYDVGDFGARQMKIYFNPAGAITICQYGDEASGRTNFEDYASILLSDTSHGCARTVYVFQLGDTGE